MSDDTTVQQTPKTLQQVRLARSLVREAEAGKGMDILEEAIAEAERELGY